MVFGRVGRGCVVFGRVERKMCGVWCGWKEDKWNLVWWEGEKWLARFGRCVVFGVVERDVCGCLGRVGTKVCGLWGELLEESG